MLAPVPLLIGYMVGFRLFFSCKSFFFLAIIAISCMIFLTAFAYVTGNPGPALVPPAKSHNGAKTSPFYSKSPPITPGWPPLKTRDGVVMGTHLGHMLGRAMMWFAVLVVSGLFAFAATGAAEDERLAAFFRRHLDETFQLQPVMATALGDHRFDGELEDLSASSRKLWEEQLRRSLKSLQEEIDPEKLSTAGRIDFEILRDDLVLSIWMEENFEPFAEDPRVYSGYLSDPVYLLLAQSSLPQETNISNSISRMKHMPKVIAAAKENLRSPPSAHLATAIQQNLGTINFFEKEMYEYARRSPQVPALRAAAAELLPHLRDYQAFLEKEVSARDPGEWRIGKDKFYRKLELTLNAGMNADRVLVEAEAEFDRVQSEMYVIARQLWSQCYPKEVLPPDSKAGKREAVRKVLHSIAQEHGKPETLTRDVRKAVKDLKQFISSRDILRLPEPDTCQVVEMPEFRRGNSTAYMQSPPPLDPKTKGYFAVSPPPKSWDAARAKSYLEEYNAWMNQILSIHEAYPGHYVQHEYANRYASLIRRVLASGVYVEGWAVYTEQTMLDQGYGDGSLPLRLTQLKFYLRAVANAILDHKMHCTEMTDEEAFRFLAEDAYQSEGEARLKVIRAKQSSVQLSTYFVGRMAMYDLRQSVQERLGSNFNLGRYHEAVLRAGPVPVKYLPEILGE